VYIPFLHSAGLSGEPLGVVEAECPHCHTRQRLVRRRLVGRIYFIPIPSGEVLVCPACSKCSRQEGIASRAFGVVILIPFLLGLAAGAATGVYMLVSMPDTEFSWGFWGIGIFLTLVAGYLVFRTISAMGRLLRARDLIPLDGLNTDI
jgi:hypothetical protein